MEIKIHDYQILILRELLFKPGVRFSDLNKTDVTSDHFTFHVNHLIKEGLIRKENGKLKGDYEESEIKDIASHYTPTPGGSGPIDVVYLYKNLIDAAKMQK